MDNTSLSNYEFSLVTDPQVMLSKNIVIKKVMAMFGTLSESYLQIVKEGLTFEMATVSPKISKGENYMGLPYVMLDYPRQFSRQDMFAIRSFFWWGNYFSISLLLSGKYIELFRNKLQTAFANDLMTEWMVQVSNDPWKHQITDEDYKPVNQGYFSLSGELSFVKLAKKIPLQEWETAIEFFEANFKELIRLIF